MEHNDKEPRAPQQPEHTPETHPQPNGKKQKDAASHADSSEAPTTNSLKTFALPAAIVVAGVLVAGAILWAANRSANVPQEPQAGDNAQELAPAQDLKPVPPVSENDHLRGNPAAPVVLIEYSDYECPFCQRFQNTLVGLMETYGKQGKVAWVYRHFPLVSIHPKALTAARASECVAELGGNDAFWRFTDIYFKNTPANNRVDLSLLPQWAQEAGVNRAAFEACLERAEQTYDQKITDSTNQALSAGARGTPFTVIMTREPLSDEAKALLNAINRQFGQEVFTLLSDTQVAVGGALPKEALEPVLKAILGEGS